ncbi:hypothetical protein [Novispirillum itersonii]|uniref:hypothetical protein n=1 Tax=Novispirillum itersonii TaxID=189 RepID=UPI000362513D|nr:hypothetical protein [Novispirillum itersonii]
MSVQDVFRTLKTRLPVLFSLLLAGVVLAVILPSLAVIILLSTAAALLFAVLAVLFGKPVKRGQP